MITFLHKAKKITKTALISSAAILCLHTLTPVIANAQMPELPTLTAPKEASGSPSLPAGPSGPAGLDDDIFGIEESFDFEKSPEQLQEEVRSQAFDAALSGLLPLRPEEIRILLERFDRTQESVVTPIYPPPKPLMSVGTLTMDPGTTPTVIKTGLGHITVINFIDLTGEPWPISGISWAGEFDILQASPDASEGEIENVLHVTPKTEYARGNMSVRLVGMQTPIILILETNRDEVHYRFDATVPKQGPFAEIPLMDGGITLAAGRADISGLLQGMIPNSAMRLNVSGVDGRTSAYNYNGMTYIRTPLTLLSPGWKNSATSADGMRVYELQNTPVALLSENGKMVRIQLTDREELLDE